MKMMRLIVAVSTLGLLLAGCTDTPPDHCANWWYYWKDGSVVGDMAKVKYVWKDIEHGGFCAPEKSQDFVLLGDAALPKITSAVAVQNKYDPWKIVIVRQIRDGGIDGCAEIISHEFKHIWVYQQWGALRGQTGLINGHQHSDSDTIPDDVETNTAPGSIGAIYAFCPTDPDSFDIHSGQGWGEYSDMGDGEVLALVEGVNNPRTTNPNADWSKGGKQWRH